MDKAPTAFEFVSAKIMVSSFFDTMMKNPLPVPEELFALEMVIQGIARLRKVDAEMVREEVAAAIRSGLGLDAAALRGMTPKGSA